MKAMKVSLETGTPRTLSRMNKRSIINCLLQNGPISRADLVKRLRLSFPSLSANVKDLLDLNLIYEGSVGNQHSVGRNSTLLCINEHYGYVAGMDVEIGMVKLAVADFTGEIVFFEQYPYSANDSMRDIADELAGILHSVNDRLPEFISRLKGVALGMHGVRDEAKSKNYLHMTDMTDIAAELSGRLNVPLTVDNDVNMAVLGERWKNSFSAVYQDIVYVNLDDGIGAGIIINGQLYRGAHNASGEWGNMLFNLPRQENEQPREVGDLENIVMSLAETGKLQIGEETLRYIGMGLVNLICVLDPQLIIVGGNIGKAFMQHEKTVRRFIEKHLPADPPKMVLAQSGNRAAVQGAIFVALENVRNELFSRL